MVKLPFLVDGLFPRGSFLLCNIVFLYAQPSRRPPFERSAHGFREPVGSRGGELGGQPRSHATIFRELTATAPSRVKAQPRPACGRPAEQRPVSGQVGLQPLVRRCRGTAPQSVGRRSLAGPRGAARLLPAGEFENVIAGHTMALMRVFSDNHRIMSSVYLPL